MIAPLRTVCTLSSTSHRASTVVYVFSFVVPRRGHTVYVIHYALTRERVFYHDYDELIDAVDALLNDGLWIRDIPHHDFITIDHTTRDYVNERRLIHSYGHDRAHELFPKTVSPPPSVAHMDETGIPH